jgi:pimeloyl-ACP methyl ester carboxylesterase
MQVHWRSAVLVSGLVAVAALCCHDELAAEEPHLRLTDDTVHLNGVDLFYRIGGSGPPLLLIHGFTSVGHFWDDLLDDFGQHYTVIVPDLRGHGRSTNPAAEFTYREAARDIFGLLDHLSIKRVKGVGFSAGGCTLLRMAAQRPDRVEAMVLIAPAHRLTLGAREALRTLPRLEELPERDRKFYQQFHPGGESQTRSLLAQARAFADNYDDFSYTPERLATIAVRTFLVWGDRDDTAPVHLALELYQALPDAALWVIPGQGHDAVWKDWGGSEWAAELFPTLALEFLAE